MKLHILFITILLLSISHTLMGAIGCSLSNPAKDLKGIFPEMTSYTEKVYEITKNKDGEQFYKLMGKKLSSELDPRYEGIETPYTVYSVYKKSELIGYVHGVNSAGVGGVISLFLSLDIKKGRIEKMMYQRLESPYAKDLRAKDFRAKFEKLSLEDFYKHPVYQRDPALKVKDPLSKLDCSKLFVNEGVKECDQILRSVMKNLILVDYFLFSQMYESFYERAQMLLSKKVDHNQ